MLPFDLINKIPPLKRKLNRMYQDRAKQISPRLAKYFVTNDRVLDIGCGTGAVIKGLKKLKKINPSLVDVDYNPMCDEYPVMIYDGKKLPFENNTFDKAMLVTVLHHCSDPGKVLDEALRVTKGKIVVMEDIFNDLPSRVITFIGDCLVNWEIHSPFTNHNKQGWLDIFEQKGLKVDKVEEFKLRCIGFPFRLAIFVLDVNKPQTKTS